uniref:Uncharacterized protein n=1 Tax=Manihot esculenta TaxID=3983 RepID=A0A2C9W504_MANES
MDHTEKKKDNHARFCRHTRRWLDTIEEECFLPFQKCPTLSSHLVACAFIVHLVFLLSSKDPFVMWLVIFL